MPNKSKAPVTDYVFWGAGWLSTLSRVFLAASLVCLALGTAQAAADPPAVQPRPVALRSQSGQFIVHGLPIGAPPVPNTSTTQVSYIRVDPALLAVSCERIKQALLSQLEITDQWKGVISVWLHPVAAFDEPIDIVSEHHTDGWSYRVHMPDQADRRRVIKAIVQVLVQEMANRREKQRAAELPPWLVEGLSGYLQETSLATLTLEPETFIVKQRERNPEPLARIRELLRARPPLSLNQLNWPDDAQFSGPNAEVYSACAQFFVYELLRLKNGRASLGSMLLMMPDYYNWQTAFLRAYQGHFARLLDVDKWWSLNIVRLTSRDMMFTWTPAQAFQQLDETLVVSAHVRLAPKDLPMTAQVRLQQMLSEWPLWRQTPLLLQKINSLENLRLRAPQELIGLVDQYRVVLASYLKARRDTGEGPFDSNPLSNDKRIIKDAVRKLDKLDAQREKLRPSLQNTNAVVANRLGPPSGPALTPSGMEWERLAAEREALRHSLQNTNGASVRELPVTPRARTSAPTAMDIMRRLEMLEAQREALRRSMPTNSPPARDQLSGTP